MLGRITPEYKASLVRKLRGYRLWKHMTLRELSLDMGLSETTLQNWLKGDRPDNSITDGNAFLVEQYLMTHARGTPYFPSYEN